MAAPVYVGGIALPDTDTMVLDSSDDGPIVVDRTGPIFQTLDDLKQLLPAVLRSGDSLLRDTWLQVWGALMLTAQSQSGFTLEAQWTARFAEGLWLDAFGELLGKPRATSEIDSDYRYRLLTGIDMITPVSIKAAVNQLIIDGGFSPLIYNEPSVDEAFCGPATISDPTRPYMLKQIIGVLQIWYAFSQPQIPLSGLPTINQSIYYAKNLRFWANYVGQTGNTKIGAFAVPIGPGFWIIAQGTVGDDSLTPRSEPLKFSTSPNVTSNLGLQNPADFVQSLASMHAVSSPLPLTPVVLGGSDRVYQRPFYLQSSITTVTVRIGNRMFSGGVPSFTGDVALFTSDGTGLATGSPLGIWPATVVPGDGSLKTLGTVPVTRGSDGKVVLVYSTPGTATIAGSATPVTWGYFTLSTLTVNPPPTPDGPDIGPALDIHLDFSSTSAVRINVRGDSISIGFNSTSYEGSVFYKLGVVQDWAVDIIGVTQYGSLLNFAAYLTNLPMWDSAYVSGATEIVQVCFNDLNYNNLSIMQTSAQTINTQLRARGAGRVFFCNCGPQAGYPGTETTRLAYNAWLTTQVASGMMINGVIDFAASQATGGIADNVTPSLIFAGYDSGDGTHPNQAGHDQMRARVLATIGSGPSPLGGGIAYGYVPQAFDTIVDRINNEVTRRRAGGVPWVFMVDLPAANAF